MLDLTDTIAAIASAPGSAPRGILRLSGPQAAACVTSLFRFVKPPDRRRTKTAARYPGWLRLPTPLGEVPCDLYLWPTARSYTQQPSAELHLPGAPPILEAALAEVCRQGARLAGPGEFTLRAFLAGRLDLTQAEAVLGVIDATSQRELDVALEQLAGGLAGPLHALREQLLDLLAHLEAGLDFVEEDIEFISAADLATQLHHIDDALQHLSAQMQGRSTAAGVYRIVLAGPPNAGKSSLLNALVGEDAALVSEIAGTTRDYVARDVFIAGRRCELIDTAGLAGATFAPDAVAETHSHQRMAEAHLILHCTAPGQWAGPVLPPGAQVLSVHTKSDLREASETRSGAIAVSAKTGAGLEVLRQQIGEILEAVSESTSLAVAHTSVRCRESLAVAATAIGRARQVLVEQGGEELVAAELRLALDELGQVVGMVYTDDVLDRIFSRFCIGK